MFKKGKKVVRILRGPGPVATATLGDVVHKVDVRSDEVQIKDENGEVVSLRYRLSNGREKAPVFPEMYSEIVVLEE